MTEAEALNRFQQALDHYDAVRAGARAIGLQTVPGADLLRGAACLIITGSGDVVSGASTDLASLDKGENGSAAAEIMTILIGATVDLLGAAKEVAEARARVFIAP